MNKNKAIRISPRSDVFYLRLLLGQPIEDVMGIDNGDDRIKAVQLADFFVHEECLHNRGRIGESRGFDDDSVCARKWRRNIS